jgi:phosphoribosylformylglycinamidine cyclo-ligase
VFNCGVGMALVVSDAGAAINLLQEQGEVVSRIGVIEAGEGAARVQFEPPAGWPA